MAEDKSLKILEKFDLSESEISIYRRLLILGKSTVLNLSKQTGIKRSSVHHYTDLLITKGLIIQTNSQGRRILIPESPDKLNNLLERKGEDLETLEERLPNILEMLSEISPKEDENFEQAVFYYNGKKAIGEIYDQILQSEEVYGIVNLELADAQFPENDQKFKEAINIRGMKLWNIVIASTISEEEFSVNRDRNFIKFVQNTKYDFEIDLLIYHNHLAIINYNEVNPTAVIIESETLFKSIKSMFWIIWDILPEYAEKKK